MITLETERLLLKTLDEENAKIVLDFLLNNKEIFKPSEPLRENEYYTLDYQEKFLKTNIESQDKLLLWLLKKDDEKLIGAISFSNIIFGAFHSCFLSYKLDQEYQNKGYMLEALKTSIDYVFNKLKLHRIEANIMPENINSINLVKKLGFYNEGIARKYLKINGKWEDHIHMVLLNEDI